MQDAIAFNGFNSLDFYDIRCNVIRIPEIISRVREAQAVWDASEEGGLELANFIVSEDHTFLGNIKLKRLMAAIVQVGLYDRYVKRYGRPEFLIGAASNDSPLLVCAEQSVFADMIRGAAEPKPSRPVLVTTASEPLLAGMSLENYSVYRKAFLNNKEIYELVDSASYDMATFLPKLINDFEVKRFVNIGPGNLLLQRHNPRLEIYDIQLLESIDLDPMLNWFWPNMRGPEFMIAQ